jgi:integrase
VTRLVRRGVSPSIIRRIVGHATTQMIDLIYAHLAPDDVAAAVLADPVSPSSI